MPALSKALFMALCRCMNVKAGVILPDHRPSLTELARKVSICRSSVRNHLFLLEVDGWITTTPPEAELARREGARTEYQLHVPGSAEFGQAREGRDPRMKREARRARAALAQEQAAAQNGHRPPPARRAVATPARPAGSLFDRAEQRLRAADQEAGR